MNLFTITKNVKLNGLEIKFGAKPSAEILSYLKGKGFRWNNHAKVWYKKYSDELLREIKAHLAMQNVIEGSAEDKNVLPGEPGKRENVPFVVRRLNLKQLFENKKAPRKDVIIREILDKRMESAGHKSFNGMTDSYDYHTVNNDSFYPAEENKYLIDNLKRAVGQSHYVYSARVKHDDELGYYISFSDYYIRYKGEKKKTESATEKTEDEFQVGDYVVLIEKYITVEKGAIGVITDIKGDQAKIYFGKNLSGQKIINSVPFYCLKIDEKADSVTNKVKQAAEFGKSAFEKGMHSAPANDSRVMALLGRGPVGDMRTLLILDAWNKAWNKANLEAPLPGVDTKKEDKSGYKVLPNGVLFFETREAAEDLLSQFDILKIAYSVSYVGETYTEVSLGEKMPSGFYCSSPRPGQGNRLPMKPLTEETLNYYKGSAYEFDFLDRNKEATALVHEFAEKGFLHFDVKEDFANGITFDFEGQNYLVFDNCGEFKIDNKTTPEYIGVVSFDDKGTIKTIQQLADEVYQIVSGNLYELQQKAKAQTEKPLPATAGEQPNSIAIAKAKAKARIRILKLRQSSSGSKAAPIIERIAEHVKELNDKEKQFQFQGKKINPHPEVDLEAEAVKDLIRSDKYNDLDFEEAKLLIGLFYKYEDEIIDGYDEPTIEIDDEQLTEEIRDTFERYEKLKYATFYQFSHTLLSLEFRGVDLVDAFRNRIKTREQVKSGTDLFPQTAGIPELKYDEKEEFAEGGNIPLSKQFVSVYEIVKKARAVNVARFADEINATNAYNKPLFDYLSEIKVPIIKVDKNALKTHTLFKLYPPPINHAVFWCLSGGIGGTSINNIYVSVLPQAYLGIAKYASKFKIDYADTLENIYTHECIHAYYNDSMRRDLAFNKELATLREHMNNFITAEPKLFNENEMYVWPFIYGTPEQVAMDKQPNVSELITYSFTLQGIKEFFQKVKIYAHGGISAWQRLVNLVSMYDKHGHLLLYCQKYGDLPAMDFSRAVMKYKLYKKKSGVVMAGGGKVEGKSHEEGGEDFTVKSTNEDVELEGGEAVIMKKAVDSGKKYEFEGKKVTPKKILDKINRDHGGNPIT